LIGLNRVVVGPLIIPPFAQYYIQFRSEHPVQYALLFIHPVVLILSGAFVLMGRNWARWLLMAWIVSVATASAWNQNFRVAVFDLVWLAVAVYYLFRPAATAFFIGPLQSAKAETEDRVANEGARGDGGPAGS
jgi:hypothetical protein